MSRLNTAMVSGESRASPDDRDLSVFHHRGPLIIYDRNDPHKNLYDVDDGISYLRWHTCPAKTAILTESTVVTLDDW
jgi:hypothetical protein